MQSTIEKIQSFADFEAGWSFGEGVAFAQNALDKASQLAKTAHTLGFHETDAFPGLNGEVMVTVYQGNEYWEFTLQPTATITFVYERDDETVTYIEQFYPPPTSSQPPIFWEFDETLLPVGFTAEQQTTASGDICHYNLLGVSDKAARNLVLRQNLADFQLCEQESARPLTADDFATQT
ncbi:MAG: hypothetical protein R3A44_41565 [Caldilineaceae bacterium]